MKKKFLSHVITGIVTCSLVIANVLFLPGEQVTADEASVNKIVIDGNDIQSDNDGLQGRSSGSICRTIADFVWREVSNHEPCKIGDGK